jgi:hypothetical protein
MGDSSQAPIPTPSGKPIPLALVDASGRTVNFNPVTVWAGDTVNPESWNIQNLQAERKCSNLDNISD